MPARPILILGGTGQARELAAALIAAGHHVITSLAGVTAAPALPPGDVRRGGFGGAAGLGRYLAENAIAAVVDATHPFAAQISRHVATAAEAAGIPCLRLERPPWVAGPGDQWIEVASLAAAAAALPPGSRPLVTVGRKEIAAFFARADLTGVARMIEAPDVAVPASWTLIRERPPFSLAHELELLRRHSITVLVSKNAGGETGRAKLAAARQTQIAVIMVARPEKPRVPACATPQEVAAALARLLSP